MAAIARLLLEMGERPAILSRGYGRRRTEDGVVVVSDGRHLLADVDRAGDEPLMLARDLPGVAVLVCDQRAIAGAFARHILRATALVLDDGFQHRQMARDVDLVLVTPGDLTGRRAPFGALREPVSALARADAVIEDRGTQGDGCRSVENPAGEKTSGVFLPASAKKTPDVFSVTGFSTDRHPSPFRLVRHTGTPVSIETGVPALAPGARVIALAGIAGPARFTRAVEDAGYVVAGAWGPGDHHRYTRADLARLARDVRAGGAAGVLTTSKDAVRLRALRPLPVPVYEWPLRVTIEPAAEFAGWLAAQVQSARGRSGGSSAVPA